MSSHPIEIILTRQLADSLSLPIFITDPEGNLLFYNEPAEDILGRRFEETGPMPVGEWATIFQPQDEKGNPLTPIDLPLVQTLTHQQPAHGSFWIESLEGMRHRLSVTSYPIIGRSNRYVGAMAFFWKSEKL